MAAQKTVPLRCQISYPVPAPSVGKSDPNHETGPMPAMTETKKRLYQLKKEHRELDAAIHEMAAELYADQLFLRRMKLRKLRLKDEIQVLEDRLIPDIDA